MLGRYQACSSLSWCSASIRSKTESLPPLSSLRALHLHGKLGPSQQHRPRTETMDGISGFRACTKYRVLSSWLRRLKVKRTSDVVAAWQHLSISKTSIVANLNKRRCLRVCVRPTFSADVKKIRHACTYVCRHACMHDSSGLTC